MAIDLSAILPSDNITTATTTSATDWDVVTLPSWCGSIEVELEAAATGPLRVSREATGTYAAANKHWDVTADGSVLIEFREGRARISPPTLSLFSSGGTGERVNFLLRR